MLSPPGSMSASTPARTARVRTSTASTFDWRLHVLGKAALNGKGADLERLTVLSHQDQTRAPLAAAVRT